MESKHLEAVLPGEEPVSAVSILGGQSSFSPIVV